MKICYLADANSSHTRKWCDFFSSKGYEIHVISLNDGEIKGVKVHSLGIDNSKVAYGGIFSKLNYVKRIFKIRSLIKEIKPNILHAHYASSYGLLGSLCKFHPFILSVWGSDIYSFPMESGLKRKIIEHNLKCADYLMSTSQDMARETSKYTNKDIMITPFGVDTSLFRPLDVKKDNKIVIGAIKTLESHYGIDYLVKAFAILCNKHDNILLKIGGKGSQLDNLKALVKDLNIENKVEFLGFLSQDEIVKQFNVFDIAVVPSLHESFGVASIEAQATGTPVVVTNAGGLPETVEGDITGFIVNKGDENELSIAIDKLIVDEDLRIKMGESARSFIEKNYRVDENFKKVDELYRKIAR
ncbi:glycosyltransferase [Clostridium cylindrosporum]|uniref:D-inositol 3-phosphate glycosyltransferase MshA n=1 Tax=Clostridium cylindrosporum DSM 605 TaxID=1121307 RepID=A0A0J8D9A0_CLOCY|nr:glycosyltransferase [Clostridium cylindrosporum]KMT22610.1 D-inositol 3-phosphate glycosyltransferase MshA [Clostridium cylindrosporum DSM 605]